VILDGVGDADQARGRGGEQQRPDGRIDGPVGDVEQVLLLRPARKRAAEPVDGWAGSVRCPGQLAFERVHGFSSFSGASNRGR